MSGGAYGLESLVGSVGAGWAIALVILTPMLWSLPIALMVAELSSMMPEEGGYYVWVRTGLGEFWGVQEGWYSICYAAVDMAIYPVLFVSYLTYFFPQLSARTDGSISWQVWLARWLIAALIIITSLLINLRGARSVGRFAKFNLLLVFTPFVLLVVIALTREGAIVAAWQAITDSFPIPSAASDGNASSASLIALGLSVVLWNYCGWDNVSTFAGEVHRPQTIYPRALFISLIVTVAAYLFPLLAGLSVTIDANVWNDEAGWAMIAALIAGKWLSWLIAAAALVSAWSLFNSQLLYVSRLPFAMAQDGWLPSRLATFSQTTGVPTTALVATCAVSAVCAALPFGKLVVIDILLYAVALTLEFAALIKLRQTQPNAHRPFRIRGGSGVLWLLAVVPLSFAAIVLVASLSDAEGTLLWQVFVVAFVIISGCLLYFARRDSVARRQLSDTDLNENLLTHAKENLHR